MLNNTVKMQCENSEIFLQNVLSNWSDHPHLKSPKPTRSQHKEFIIQHFVGDVVYNVVCLISCMLFKPLC